MPEKDPFYVGYLPLPAPIKRFLLPWLIGNVVLAIGIAVVFASQHREPGDGTWENSEAVTIEGWLSTEPYPILRDAQGKTYILVEQGKRGVQERLQQPIYHLGVHGMHCNVTGFVIERDGRTVFEVDGSSNEAIAQIDGPPPIQWAIDLTNRRLSVESLGTHTLTGEIVDPKCYLGVMQPGDGKTHKTCATLCIKGGIPPMLLVRDQAGNTAAYLLTDHDGKPMPESIHPYIADPIELTGRVFRDGDLLVFRADFSTIRRLESGP